MNDASENPYASPLTPPEAPSYQFPGELASRDRRFFGALLDGLILFPLSFGGGYGLGLRIGMWLISIGVDPAGALPQTLMYTLGTLFGIGTFLVVNGYLLATRGQTAGKVIVKTRIVRNNGERMPFGEMVLKRYLPMWILCAVPGIGSLISIVNALAIFRSSHKCLHDDLAGTKVIRA